MEIRKILAPIDFSGCSIEELRWATTMANIFGTELITLNVISPETVEVYAREGSDWNSLREEVGSDIGLAALEHEENIVEGEPVEKFLHVIKLHDIDFVVISTHGRTGISHALMGALRKSSWQNRRSRCSR